MGRASDAGQRLDSGAEATPFGVLSWSQTVGSNDGLDVLLSAAIARDGGVIVTGVTHAEELGDWRLGRPGVAKNVVVRLAGERGEIDWVVSEEGIGGAIVADAGGGVIVRGAESLIRIGPQGDIDWRRARAPGRLSALAIGADGRLYSAGYLPEAGDVELVVAGYDSGGGRAWTQSYPVEGDGVPNAIAVAPGGDVFIAGTLTAAIELGGEILEPQPGALRDGFVARLSPSGDVRWAELLPSGERTSITGLGSDARANLVVAGNVVYPDGSTRRRESFVIQYDGNGEPGWERRLSLEGVLHAAAVDGRGGVVLAGRGGGGDVGGDPLSPFTRFVARYGRDGSFSGQWLARDRDSDIAALAATDGAIAAAGQLVRDAERCAPDAPRCNQHGLVQKFELIAID